jgi:hypothetical protein
MVDKTVENYINNRRILQKFKFDKPITEMTVFFVQNIYNTYTTAET